MVCSGLREFLSLLEDSGELHHVPVPVDPDLEIAAVTRRVSRMAGGGPALLFEAANGTDIPVASNIFGSERRISMALGGNDLGELSARMRSILAQFDGASSIARLEGLVQSDLWRSAAPVELPGSPCLEMPAGTEELDSLPFPKGWPGDGYPDHPGRFLTLPLVITRNRAGCEINCGMYRVALLEQGRLAVHWNASSGAAVHADEWLSAGEAMPVAIALGGPPSLTFAATLPLPSFLDEFTFAGLLQGEPLAVGRSRGYGLPFPESAELLIEGVIDPGAVTGDGAFGNHTGYYQPASGVPLIRVTSVSRRSDMILPVTVVGQPPMEDCWMAMAWGALLLPLLQTDLPCVASLHQPFGGIFHGGTIVSLDASAAGRGREVLTRLWQGHWLCRARLLILVDAEQDAADPAGVYWRVMNNVDWASDLVIEGQRLGIDATRKPRDTREPLRCDQETTTLVEKRWQEYGFK